MAKRLDCPIDGCDASIEGETEDEILDQASAHAGDAHPDLELDDELVASLRSQIRETH